MRIRTLPSIIFFDVAFTLIRPNPGAGVIYSEAARPYGVEADPDKLELAFRAAWKSAREACNGLPYGPTDAQARKFWRGVVQETFRMAGKEMPADPYFDIVFDRFATAEAWMLFDDVPAAFERVRAAGLRIGVLSNFDSRLRPLLESMGLMPYVDCLVVSCEAGAEKPDPRIFLAAEKCAGATAGECVLIGDLEREDYGAASAAGWQAALIDRQAGPNPPRQFNHLVPAVEWFLQ